MKAREIRIPVSAEQKYYVRIHTSWKKSLLKHARGRSTLIIAPEIVVNKFRLKSLVKESKNLFLTIVPEGEAQKSFTTYENVINVCAEVGIKRDGLIVGIGGGATTDLAGFVAASWLRGVEWLAIPTTVAGMVDAAVGGKTGINTRYGKNLVGSFYSPIEVLIDLAFLRTLPQRDLVAGMAEIVKCGFIADPSILTDLSSLTENSTGAIELTPSIIAKAIRVKAQVVAADFKESYQREVLNYGHTLGHAIEKHSHYSLRHGEAIAIGLVYAAELSAIVEKLSPAIVSKHREVLTSMGLPISYPSSAWPALLTLMTGDKKVKKGKIRFVTLKRIGKTGRGENITPHQMKRAYERIAQ